MVIKKDFVAGAVALGLSSFAYFAASAFNREGGSVAENPALYPRGLAVTVFGLGLLLLLQAARERRPDERAPSTRGGFETLHRVGLPLVLLCGYALGIYLVGFIFPTLAFTLAMPVLLGSRLKTALWLSLPLTAVLYLVFFVFFRVPIPRGVVLG